LSVAVAQSGHAVGEQVSVHSGSASGVGAKLPKLRIPKFNGNVLSGTLELNKPLLRDGQWTWCDGLSTSRSVPSDIGEWSTNINDAQQNEVLARGSELFKKSDADFLETGRVFSREMAKRYCQSSFSSYKH
jgi:hypothetical protein